MSLRFDNKPYACVEVTIAWLDYAAPVLTVYRGYYGPAVLSPLHPAVPEVSPAGPAGSILSLQESSSSPCVSGSQQLQALVD